MQKSDQSPEAVRCFLDGCFGFMLCFVQFMVRLYEPRRVKVVAPREMMTRMGNVMRAAAGCWLASGGVPRAPACRRPGRAPGPCAPGAAPCEGGTCSPCHGTEVRRQGSAWRPRAGVTAPAPRPHKPSTGRCGCRVTVKISLTVSRTAVGRRQEHNRCDAAPGGRFPTRARIRSCHGCRGPRRRRLLAPASTAVTCCAGC